MSSDVTLDSLLAKLLKREYKDIVSEYKEQWEAAYELVKLGEPAVLPLIELLKNPNGDRRLIASTLGEIGDERAVEPLIEALKILNTADEYFSERREIVYALAKFNDPRAVDVLLEALNHRLYYTGDDGNRYEEIDEKTVEAIEWALAEIADPRALKPVFQRILDDWYQDGELLKEWGEPAFDLVMNEVQNLNSNRRSYAISLLGDFDDPRAVELLIALLQNDKNDDVRSSAAYALCKLKDPRAFDIFVQALHDPYERTRQWGVQGLQKLKDKRAVDALKKALEDEDLHVRNSARFAINYIEKTDVRI